MDVVRYILNDINQIMKSKTKVDIALSGGLTPVPLYNTLCSIKIDWSKITFTLIDDRMVPSSHADSNQKLIKETILTGHSKNASFIKLQDWSIKNIPDIAIIGMGKDGHFASLFPNMLEDKFALNPEAEPKILITEPNGIPFHARITMNLAMILKIPRRYLILNSEKIKIFNRIFAGKDLPIKRLISIKGTNVFKV